jgi:hypothetical protein
LEIPYPPSGMFLLREHPWPAVVCIEVQQADSKSLESAKEGVSKRSNRELLEREIYRIVAFVSFAELP